MKRKLNLIESAPVKCVRRAGSARVFFATDSKPNLDLASTLASLMVAAQKGYLDIVKFHIENSPKDYSKEVFGPLRRNLLHLAATSGNTDLIKFLIQNRVTDIFARDELYFTPVELAFGAGKMIIMREIYWEKRKGVIYCYKYSTAISLPMSLIRHMCIDFLY